MVSATALFVSLCLSLPFPRLPFNFYCVHTVYLSTTCPFASGQCSFPLLTATTTTTTTTLQVLILLLHCFSSTAGTVCVFYVTPAKLRKKKRKKWLLAAKTQKLLIIFCDDGSLPLPLFSYLSFSLTSSPHYITLTLRQEKRYLSSLSVFCLLILLLFFFFIFTCATTVPATTAAINSVVRHGQFMHSVCSVVYWMRRGSANLFLFCLLGCVQTRTPSVCST